MLIARVRRENFWHGKGDCTKVVQRGKTPVLTGAFEWFGGLFHMVFNKTVENFYRKFIKCQASRDRSGRRIAGDGNSRARGVRSPSDSAASTNLC
jgi:hypothetical protein